MKNTQTNVSRLKRNIGIVMLTLCLGLNGWAEETPVPSAPVVPTAPPVGGTEGFYGDPNSIQNNLPTGEVSGREYKANDATNQGNSGQGAAIAAGAALMGASAAAFAALNIPLGVTLATMAGLEFAQAGADGSSSSANSGQESMLRQNANSGTQTSYDPNAAAAAIEGTGAATVLGNMGIANPEEFINEMANGNITTPEQVLNAIGQTGNFTSEEIAAMGNFENVDLEGIKYEEGNAAAAILGMDDASDSVASASARGLASKEGELAGGNGQGANGENGASAHASGNGKTGNGGASLSTDGEAAGSFNFAKPGTAAASGFASLSQMDRSQLKKLGVLKPHGKQTIFQIASRNYRSFQSWRKNKLRTTPVKASTTQKVAKVSTIKLR